MPLKFQPIKPSRAKTQKLGRFRQMAMDILQDFVVETQGILQAYPPTGPSSYRRTGTLGRSWHHEVKNTAQAVEGIVASQGQIAPYNVYVQGSRQSGRMRSRGWKTPKDTAKELQPKFKGKVQIKVKELAK